MAKGSDKYILRSFKPEDYKQFSSWFDNSPTMEDLPKVGLVSGDMKAVGFMYNTDSAFCIIAFWHVNPQNTKRESYEALKTVVQGLCDAAKIFSKKNVFITTTNRGMITLLKSMGFYNASGHLILRL